MNFDQVRVVAEAYEHAVKTSAELMSRDLQVEALAAIVGAARCLAYPVDLQAIVNAAVEDARNPVDTYLPPEKDIV